MPNSDLEAAELWINNYYRFFHTTTPGTVVREEGQLAEVWRFVDAELAKS